MPHASRPDTVQLAARIPKTLHRAARLQAIADDEIFMDWIADALTAHLARLQAEPALQVVPAKA